MELVYETQPNGERELAIWNGARRIAGIKDVEDQRALEALVNGTRNSERLKDALNEAAGVIQQLEDEIVDLKTQLEICQEEMQ